MLKGQNRRYFERRLTENARLMLGNQKVDAAVRLISGRLYVEGPENAASAMAIEDVLDHLIGITGWGKARISEKTIEGIQAAVYEEALIAKAEGARTFKIETRRADKGFPLTSYQVSAAAPERIVDEGLLSVDVHHPEAVINVEIRDRVLVYGNAHKSCWGLPVGPLAVRRVGAVVVNNASLYLPFVKSIGRFDRWHNLPRFGDILAT